MATRKIRIIVKGVGGVKLASEEGYHNWLKRQGVVCLLDNDGDQVVDFQSLAPGGTYTLGPLVKKQKQEDSRTNMNVNDEQGNWLARVKVGDTKSKALERISWLGPGGLIDKDGFGLLDTDTINEDSGPYVFKRQPQQGKFSVVVSLSHCIEVAYFLFSSDTHVPHPFIMLTPAPTSISTNWPQTTKLRQTSDFKKYQGRYLDP